MSKLAWIVVFATFSAAPAAAQGAIPDMRGTWKGESESIILGAGNPHHAAPPSTEPRLNSVAFTMTVDQQDGRRFSGTFSSARSNDKFVAVISRNNTILLVDATDTRWVRSWRRTAWSFATCIARRRRAWPPAPR